MLPAAAAAAGTPATLSECPPSLPGAPATCRPGPAVCGLMGTAAPGESAAGTMHAGTAVLSGSRAAAAAAGGCLEGEHWSPRGASSEGERCPGGGPVEVRAVGEVGGGGLGSGVDRDCPGGGLLRVLGAVSEMEGGAGSCSAEGVPAGGGLLCLGSGSEVGAGSGEATEAAASAACRLFRMFKFMPRVGGSGGAAGCGGAGRLLPPGRGPGVPPGVGSVHRAREGGKAHVGSV